MRWIIEKNEKEAGFTKGFLKNDLATKKVLICLW